MSALSLNMDTNIIGLSLGTRTFGYAIVSAHELVDWRIRSWQGKWSNKKLKKILRVLDTLIDLYGIQHIAIKIPDELPKSVAFQQLIGGLNVFFQGKNITVRYYRLSEIKALYGLDKRASKQKLLPHIVKQYPELLYEQERIKAQTAAYYLKLFEAIAAAYCLQQEHIP